MATGDADTYDTRRVLNETAVRVANFRTSVVAPELTSHTVPLLPPGSYIRDRTVIVRVVNRSNTAGTVEIHAIDDDGERFGPVTLSLDAKQTRQFNSRSLENGAVSWLSGGVGEGRGHWWLELSTELDIVVRAFMWSPDILASMDHVVEETWEGSNVYHVTTFNPGSNSDGSNPDKQSWLRLINPGDDTANIIIRGQDDEGNAAPGGEVQLSLAAGAARMLNARQLEEGIEDDRDLELSGHLGDGERKWQLFISADRPLLVMNIISSLSSGQWTNLSRGQLGAAGEPPAGIVGPDLVVHSPSVSDDSPRGGSTFKLSATVANQGDAPSAATLLSFHASADAAISTEDVQIGSIRVPELAVSQTNLDDHWPFDLNVRAPVTRGPYYYGACVEPVSGESRTHNNSSTGVRVTVPPYWGSIAAALNSSSCAYDWGWSFNYSNRDSAIARAKLECQVIASPRTCDEKVTYAKCGALAYGYSNSSDCGLYGGSGDMQSAAEQAALARCREDFSSSECRIASDDDTGSKASYCNRNVEAISQAEARSDGKASGGKGHWPK